MPSNQQKNAVELRDLLLQTIEGVKDGSIDPQKGRAIAELSKAVGQIDKLGFEMMVFAARAPRHPSRIQSEPTLAITHTQGNASDESEDDDSDDEPPSAQKQPPPKGSYTMTVKALLKSKQPLELDEIASITKIPKAELFKVLADEELFERDTDRLYWIAK